MAHCLARTRGERSAHISASDEGVCKMLHSTSPNFPSARWQPHFLPSPEHAQHADHRRSVRCSICWSNIAESGNIAPMTESTCVEFGGKTPKGERTQAGSKEMVGKRDNVILD